MIKELIESKFYGELLLKWEAGNIQLIRKTETIVNKAQKIDYPNKGGGDEKR